MKKNTIKRIIKVFIGSIILCAAYYFVIYYTLNTDFSRRPPIKEIISTDYPVVIDSTVIDEAPKTIVCLDEDTCLVLDEMGKGDLIVATGSENKNETYTDLPKMGEVLELKTDDIIALKPDMVITKESLMFKDVETLSDKNIHVITLLDDSQSKSNLELMFKGNQE